MPFVIFLERENTFSSVTKSTDLIACNEPMIVSSSGTPRGQAIGGGGASMMSSARPHSPCSLHPTYSLAVAHVRNILDKYFTQDRVLVIPISALD